MHSEIILLQEDVIDTLDSDLTQTQTPGVVIFVDVSTF